MTRTRVEGTPGIHGGAPVAVALISAMVLLLQLVQTRVFSFMMWHHLTYLVVTFTMLGFAAAGALLACTSYGSNGTVRRGMAVFCVASGLSIILAYSVLTHLPAASFTSGQILTAALRYGVAATPMLCGGMVVALALRESAGRMGRTYAWNLGGSALGCVLFAPVLTDLGGEGAILFCVVLAFAAAAAVTAGRVRVLWSAVALITLVVARWTPTSVFQIPMAPSKTLSQMLAMDPNLTIEETRWDPTCRVDVLGPRDGDPAAHRTIFQDGDSPSIMPMGPAQEQASSWSREGLAYHLFPDSAPRVLCLGIGGGIDIVQARAPRSYPDGSQVQFTGVELHDATVDLMRTTYAERVGRRYELPGVEVHQAEGRAWLRRSEERYDIIQLTGTDTYVALSSGSYVMSESFLYTLEAFEDYLDHLTDDGVLSIWRLRFQPPRETLRLVALAVAALRHHGCEDPWRHLLLLGIEGPRIEVDGRPVGLDFCALLLRKSAFTRAQLEVYRRFAQEDPATGILFDPVKGEGPGAYGEYFTAVREHRDGVFRASYAYDLSTPTDDRPFFFRYHRWGDAWRGLLGIPPARPTRSPVATQTDPSAPEDYVNLLGNQPVGLMMLATVLIEGLVLVVLLAVVPLLVFRRQGLRTRGKGRWLLAFAGLGAGYLLVEVVAMQRCVLFLGHPGYSITVVLVTFLLFSALGAAAVGAGREPGRTFRVATAVVLVLLVLLGLGLPLLFDVFLAEPLAMRVALTVATLAPLAFVMGMPFPSVLEMVSSRSLSLVPWAFAVNGGMSVLASVAAIALAMAAGFTTVFVAAGLAYLLAFLAMAGHADRPESGVQGP